VAQAIAIRPLKTTYANTARTLSEEINENSVLTISDTSTTLEVDGTSGQIKAFPNPVSDQLNISLKGYVEEEPSDNSFVILDAMGRSHFVPRTWFGDESRLELDFSRMHKGFYIINIRTLHGIKTIRVMKQSQ
jgi:hypothetical protein